MSQATQQTIEIEGCQIPIERMIATYTPRADLRTPPILLIEWGEANLFFTGNKANAVVLQLRALRVPIETILQVKQ